MPNNAPDYVLSSDIAEVIFVVHTPEWTSKYTRSGTYLARV